MSIWRSILGRYRQAHIHKLQYIAGNVKKEKKTKKNGAACFFHKLVAY